MSKFCIACLPWTFDLSTTSSLIIDPGSLLDVIRPIFTLLDVLWSEQGISAVFAFVRFRWLVVSGWLLHFYFVSSILLGCMNVTGYVILPTMACSICGTDSIFSCRVSLMILTSSWITSLLSCWFHRSIAIIYLDVIILLNPLSDLNLKLAKSRTWSIHIRLLPHIRDLGSNRRLSLLQEIIHCLSSLWE